MRKLTILLFVAAACATQPDTSMHAPSTAAPAATAVVAAPCPAMAASLNATLWMQTSAEYQAITRETYRTARTQLDLALADPAWSAIPDVPGVAAKPPAIVLDLDETAIDTSAETARRIRSGKGYTDQAWMDFSMKGNSRAIAAARDFLRYAAGRNVAVFYVSNRNKSEEEPLRANLSALGFPLADSYDNILTRGERPEWTSDKTSRRMFVAGNYRVVLLLGDDLNDFVNAGGKSLADRQELLNRYDDMWGRKWFVLPNPVYGSWERATVAGVSGDCAQFQKKIETLRTDEDYKP
jgi:5'-nucleotidase (lipoprotein e(P4) family)